MRLLFTTPGIMNGITHRVIRVIFSANALMRTTPPKMIETGSLGVETRLIIAHWGCRESSGELWLNGRQSRKWELWHVETFLKCRLCLSERGVAIGHFVLPDCRMSEFKMTFVSWLFYHTEDGAISGIGGKFKQIKGDNSTFCTFFSDKKVFTTNSLSLEFSGVYLAAN